MRLPVLLRLYLAPHRGRIMIVMTDPKTEPYQSGDKRLVSKNEAVRIVNFLIENDDIGMLSDFFFARKGDRRPISSLVKRIENNAEIVRVNAKTIQLIDEFYYHHYGDYPFYEQLLSRLGDAVRDQTGLDQYLGDYIVYYATTEKPNFLTGHIELIKKDNGSVIYRSNTKLADNNDPIPHNGYVFLIMNRLYFTGLGFNFTRPILVDVTNKILETDILSGIVMSITEKQKVFATRLALIHKSNKKMFAIIDSDQVISHFSDTTNGSNTMIII